MIDNYYDLSCELQAYSDAELMGRGQYASLMIDKKIWSWERGAKYAGVQNPEAERKAIILDDIYRSPEYMQLIIQGAIADDPMAAQAMTMAQTMGPPAGAPPTGAPPAPATPSAAPGGHREGMQAPVSAGGRASGAPRNPTGPGHNGAVPQSR
jgi:hypothetical protein